MSLTVKNNKKAEDEQTQYNKFINYLNITEQSIWKKVILNVAHCLDFGVIFITVYFSGDGCILKLDIFFSLLFELNQNPLLNQLCGPHVP